MQGRKELQTLGQSAGLRATVQLTHVCKWDFCTVVVGKWRLSGFGTQWKEKWKVLIWVYHGVAHKDANIASKILNLLAWKLTFFFIILTVRIFFDSVNYFKREKKPFGSLILFSSGNVLGASWKCLSFTGEETVQSRKLEYLVNLKAFALPQWWQQTHREHSVNYKGADLVNEGGIVSLLSCFDRFQSHGQAKTLLKVPASHHLPQTSGFTHPSWPGSMECCPSEAAGAPGKPGEDLPEMFCGAAQVLWQLLGWNPPPQCSWQPWPFGMCSQKETLGNTCWHFASGSEKISSAQLPVISHLNITGAQMGAVQPLHRVHQCSAFLRNKLWQKGQF